MIARLTVLLSTLVTSAAGTSGRPDVTGTVFVTSTVVAMPGSHFTVSAADDSGVYAGLGRSIVFVDFAVDPPTTDPVAEISATVTALAVDRARLWVGDSLGGLHAFDRSRRSTVDRVGSIRLASDDAPQAITRVAIDGARAFAVVASTGLAIVDLVDGDLSLRGRIGRWDTASQLGAIDGKVYAWVDGKFALVDPSEVGHPKAEVVSLMFDPNRIHHNFWGPEQFEVDPVHRQLVAVGGVVGWAGRPRSPAFAIAFDLDKPLEPVEVGRASPHYIDGHHLVLGQDWVYFVSSSYWPGGANPTTSLTAFERHGGLQRAQEWWRGSGGVGMPAPLPGGRVFLPIDGGGFMVLTPFVGGRAWLPIGWR